MCTPPLTRRSGRSRGAGHPLRLGDQDQLAPHVAALTDAVGLGGAIERKGLHLDHEFVLCQQLGYLRQSLHRAAVVAAAGYPGAGMPCREMFKHTACSDADKTTAVAWLPIPAYGRNVETTSLSDLKSHLSEYADRVEHEHERFIITRKGRPAIVLVSADE